MYAWLLNVAFRIKYSSICQQAPEVDSKRILCPAKPRMERENGWTFTFKIFQAGIKVLHSVHVRPEWVDG